MKKFNLLPTIFLIVLVIGASIYNHYDRVRSEKIISKEILKFKKDVDYFVYCSELFTDKVDTLFVKLDKRKE